MGEADLGNRGTPAYRRRPAVAAGGTGMPGLGLAALSAVLAGSAFYAWGVPRLLGTAETAGSAGSAIAAVAQADFPDALSTMDFSDALRAKIEANKRCSVLATVTLSSATGGVARVRLQSGRYSSPVFSVGSVPVRVAIPYPDLYRIGHGTLLAFADGGVARVSLMPPWEVHASATPAAREVHWTPAPPCPASGAR